ncbi:hypothetical protein [Mycobacterium sp. SM1]|uniref:hypothetical protein n=1 Tax=Mycobacterium sp. SM1 TaxID=2816243 RepID=UPI0027DBC3B7|nr:hypothetical protein [Mycobacterium sp. SM1]
MGDLGVQVPRGHPTLQRFAIQRAEDVLRQELVTVMEPEQFDKLVSSLDAADSAPRLAAAARKPAAFQRR